MTSSSPRPWRPSSPASPRRSTAASPGEHIAELLRRSGARVLVAAGPDLAPEVWEQRARARRRGRDRGPARPAPDRGRARLRRSCSRSTACGSPTCPRWRRSSHTTAFVGEPPSATDLAALFHTGGTTGTPKLAAHTHANEVSDAWMIAAIGVLDDRRRWCSPRCRSSTSTPWSSPCWRRCSRGSGSSGRDPWATATQTLFANFWKVVERYRVSHDERRAHRLRGPRRAPRRRRHQQPALRPRRRLPPAAGGPRDGSSPPPGSAWSRATASPRPPAPAPAASSTSPVPGSVGQRLPYQQVKTVEVDCRR